MANALLSAAPLLAAVLLLLLQRIIAWVPDSQAKHYIKHGDLQSDVFYGNRTHLDYFKLLDQQPEYLLLGGRNVVYNISLNDLAENKEQGLEWRSSMAHREMCYLKGKTEDECQNYVRVFARINPERLSICGTNSYKPMCRQYELNENKFVAVKESDSDGIGQSPYNPEHNSTALYYNGQLFAATVSEFSGGDSFIYRKPQRTEISDLKQLNAPNFVSSFGYGDYVFFFYRETAVEHINCGKAIYSRVARICKDDKGGPFQFGNRWTSFLKARLNCSVPGEYPFYFDEIQAASDVIRGNYGNNEELVYTVMTTPINAIGGSAVCVFTMQSILKTFEGTFKEQYSINSNWLPVPSHKIPEPHPGKCVTDSRTLPGETVNFIKMHPLMEQTVQSLYSQPILIRVSLQYRFTSIAVDQQVQALDGKTYDVVYVGTDEGRVLKIVNTHVSSNSKVHSVVITESQVMPTGVAITNLKVISEKNKLVVISQGQVRTVSLNHCINFTQCSICVELQDPHCAWDLKLQQCVALNSNILATRRAHLVQSIINSDVSGCGTGGTPHYSHGTRELHQGTVSSIGEHDIDNKIIEEVKRNVLSQEPNKTPNDLATAPVQERLVIYTAETLHIVLIASSIAALAIGFVAGYLFSRRFHPIAPFANAPFIEQHNHLNRLGNPSTVNSPNQSNFLAPRANKAINLHTCNIPVNKVTTKKDNNLDSSKELNNSTESINKDTLQKVKKTYI